jgi:K(+)-stimulated pyrophosphate-energized sodium pump
MLSVIASEGGYQSFELDGAAWTWLSISLAISAVALLAGGVMMRGVLAKATGTEKMIEIAGAVQEGAMAYDRCSSRCRGLCDLRGD